MLLKSFLVGFCLFLFPGYALLVVLRPRHNFALIEMLCAAVGLSLAVVPLVLYVSTFYLGVRLTPTRVILLMLAAGGICIWDWVRRFLAWRKLQSHPFNVVHLLLGIVFVATLSARLFMVRNIDYPLWTDSYHHTLITQLIADSGKVPSSYEPYAPIHDFTYHFGFHALAAWFHWLSGIAIPRSVVLVGQIINALVVPTCYLLAKYMTCDDKAGLVAALVTGLLSHLPALFVNWGRYPQLCGQMLLPILMLLILLALDQQTIGRASVLAVLGAAALFLIHIRVFLFFVAFAGLAFVFQCIDAWRSREFERIKRLSFCILLMACIGLVILFPWLLRFLRGFGMTVIHDLAQGYQVERDSLYFQWRTRNLIVVGMSPVWLALAAVGGLWGALKQRFHIYLLLLWIVSLFLAANTHLVGLMPLFPSDVVIILIYLPAAVLIGYLASEWIKLGIALCRKYANQVLCKLRWGVSVILILISLYGMYYTMNLIAPQNSFVRAEDLVAMRWIEQNVSEDALFYINTHFWTPAVAHGLDAGYWIPFLTGRQTVIPPETYASDGSESYMKLVNERAYALVKSNTPEQLWSVMRVFDVTHVYIGKREVYLTPSFFVDTNEYFHKLYEQDGVWIFEVQAQK